MKKIIFLALLLMATFLMFISCAENHQHTYISKITVKEATHTENGIVKFMCSCGESYTEEIGKTTIHTYSNKTTKEPTHTEYGIRTFTCECGNSYTEEIAKTTEHTYTSEVTKEPTHLTVGTKTFTCACGDGYTEDIEKTTEHTYTDKVTKEPTHTESGVLTYTCACGDSYTEEIAKITEHTYIDDKCECGATLYVKMWDVSANAEDDVAAKLYNSNNDFYFLKIIGIGNMKSWDSSYSVPWHSYEERITSVEIEDSVTNIGAYAFTDCTRLTSVAIPNSVISIGSYSFAGCTGLTSVAIPNSVTRIGFYAFTDCTGLNKVNIENLASWCGIIFQNSHSNPLFYAKNLYINDKLVTNLVIPENVTSIGSLAFRNCTGLTSVTISESITNIGAFAFDCCPNLTEINFNAIEMDDLSKNSDVFCYSGLGGEGIKVTFGNKVTKIPAYLFYGVSKITSVTIPNGVTHIGFYAFTDCTELTSVTFENTQGWFADSMSIDVTDPKTNAKNLTIDINYYSYHWYRNP